MLLGTTEHRSGYGASARVLRLQIIIDNITKIMQLLFRRSSTGLITAFRPFLLSSLFASTFAIEAVSSTHSYLPFSKFQAFHPLTTTGLAPLVILSLLNFKVEHLNI